LVAGVENGEAINDFQILLGVIAAVGVAAQAYKNKKAYDELQRRYSLAQQTYASAKRELEIGKVPPERVLIAVGREALLENSDWLWTHRNVPIEVPKG
jgi:protein-disulfide isomerase-like protein with CxxC motif